MQRLSAAFVVRRSSTASNGVVGPPKWTRRELHETLGGLGS